MSSNQLGFYFDESRCVQCRACETACKSARDVEPGVQLIHISETWGGRFPDVTLVFSANMCLHCAEPTCIDACPTGAIIKRAEDGIVVVETSLCNGCKECLPACPYGIPRFGRDGKMQKCDFCISTGREPACAAACPADALVAGNLEELKQAAMTKSKSLHKTNDPAVPSIVVVS